WYPHFPDSSFRGNIQGYAWLGSAIYAVAIVPTMVLLIGIARAIGSFMRNPIVTLAAALLLSNLAIVIAAGVRYDVWACFQSRLCFQSLAPAIVLFGVGMQTISRVKIARWIVYVTSAATIACSLLYFVIEVALTYGMLPRGPELLP
ncbi:MAG: hypothetical protein H7Z14_12065, partial [Anaerolineae bacterium]|nr:hypothetical protein [Phycisphaerae bacterium]